MLDIRPRALMKHPRTHRCASPCLRAAAADKTTLPDAETAAATEHCEQKAGRRHREPTHEKRAEDARSRGPTGEGQPAGRIPATGHGRSKNEKGPKGLNP